MTSALIARYYVVPGNAPRVEETLRKMAERVKADEPACLLYNANVDPENENLYCLYEVYENEDAVAAHRETPHFAEFIEGIIVPLLEKRERELYRQVIG
ncbi:putative quinol monooxygenase [Lacisediminihabitans profunda]|uniref:Antibiotic biosynthesis monooxygenase n=1 Tax=Lacisediminihabitans profunda TaxID=2594790 RepID=A0A5C8UMA9_9MICO|nr:putative quinol monooxygenase [Lacisediminihabitans profunda]TXN29482.1 antibiotic biosynthesis monooxygenase [Lacisediminihabitans profunda]